MQTHMKFLVLPCLLLAFPAALSGQIGRELPREARASQEVRQECQRAAAALLAGAAADEAEELVGELMFCEISAPPALAAAWRNPVVRSNALSRLVTASQKNQDKRVVEAVLPVFQDESEDFDVRLAGLAVLTSYVVRSWQGDPTHWYKTPAQEWPTLIGRRIHGTWSVGPEPVDAEARERIVEALNEVLDTSEDARLNRVIEQVLRW